jgi:Tfp pilus assembly protein PilN/Tfp pilus assembly PilM family ATPase
MKPIYLEKSLGIDIREQTVALTLLGKGLRSVDIIASHFFQIPPLGPDNEKAEMDFLDRVNRFLIKRDIWPENVVVSMPRSQFTFQTFELPAPDLKSVNSMVVFELERHFSAGMGGLYHGFQAKKKTENQFHIVSAAIKKETANYYLALINRLGIDTTRIELSDLANVNLVLNGLEQKNMLWAIVDLSSHEIDITIVKDRRVEFSRNFQLDDPDFRDTYFRSDLPQDHYEALSAGLSKIIVENLEDTLASCRNLTDSETIEQIHLVGGGPFAPYLANRLEEDTEVPTLRAKLSDKMNTRKCKGFTTAFMATSFSLAMSGLKAPENGINLLPVELLPKKQKTNLKFTLGLTAAVLLLALGLVINKIVYNNTTLASLNHQLEEIKNQVGDLEKIDLEFNNLKLEIDRLNAIRAKYPIKVPILAELSRTLPPDTWLTSLKISKKQVEIKGYSSLASKLVPLLEQSPYFQETNFVGTILKESKGEKFTIRTQIAENKSL